MHTSQTCRTSAFPLTWRPGLDTQPTTLQPKTGSFFLSLALNQHFLCLHGGIHAPENVLQSCPTFAAHQRQTWPELVDLQEKLAGEAGRNPCGRLPTLPWPDHLVWWMECWRRRTYSFSGLNLSLNHHAMHPPVECFVLLPRWCWTDKAVVC